MLLGPTAIYHCHMSMLMMCQADRIRLKQWRVKINYALLSTVAADRLTTGDNQRIERSKGVRTRQTMRVNKAI